MAEIVGEEMHGQRRHRDVHFVAMRTLLGAIRVQVAMSLFVARQVGGRGVAFATFVARVSLLLAFGRWGRIFALGARGSGADFGETVVTG